MPDSTYLTSDQQALLIRAKQVFEAEFKVQPSAAAMAPGRVNLIGEHTDYNDGFVFPMALPLVTICVGRKTSSESITLLTLAESVSEPKRVELDIHSNGRQTLTPGEPKWANYVKGVIAHYPGAIGGFEMVIASSIPLGGGLSSSASLEVATFTLLEALFPLATTDLKQKALICQKAEHTFAGMPCGIMDQFIATMGQKDHALLIDCESMESVLIKLDMPDKAILVINSNVKHELTGSEYPSRRNSCFQAASALGVKSLRYADMQLLQSHRETLDPVTYRRARHVITEIERTQQATDALRRRDLERFGALMVQSHTSLRDDYEVSCPELDQLVDIALTVPGVFGSRMTGGGFGGCTVTLCDKVAVPEVMKRVKEHYTGVATFTECTASDGAQILVL